MDWNYIVNTNLMMITLLKTLTKVAVLLRIRPQQEQECPRVSTDYHVSTIITNQILLQLNCQTQSLITYYLVGNFQNI